MIKIPQATGDDQKFKELVLYISQKSEGDLRFGATKLNKLLFFSDFLAYKIHGESITGHVYFRLDHGPAPRQLLPLKQQMIDDGWCVEVSRNYFGHPQRVLLALREPDLSLFTGVEIALIDRIIEECRPLNAKEISGESHGFIGWKLADDQEEIPYETALLSFGEVTEKRLLQVRMMKSELDKLHEECRQQAS